MNQRTSYGFTLAVAILVGLFFLASCNGTDLKVTEKKTPVISAPPANTTYPMPPLETNSLNNLGWTLSDGKHSLFSEFKGKVLVLDFYATWCGPCRRSIPHLIELQKKFGEQGLQVIGLNVGGPRDDETKISDFARELGIQYPLAMPDDELAGFLLSDNSGIPQTFIFDREGRLVEREIGYGSSSAARIDAAVESALQTSTP